MQKPNPKGHKHYDRILRENISTMLPDIIRKFLNIEVSESRPLSTDLPKTIELKPDAVFEVLTTDQNRFILHFEFQSQNDPDMAIRMAKYKFLLGDKYKLEIRQFVIFLGPRPSTMSTELPPMMQYSGFEILNLCQIDINAFKDAASPEELVLSVLSNFPADESETVIKDIVQRLFNICDNPHQFQKAIQQLTVLSQLRKLDSFIKENTADMPITIDLRENVMYKDGLQQGLQQGLEQGREQGIQQGRKQGYEESRIQYMLNMWRAGRYSLSEIARIFEIDVEELQRQLKLATENEKRNNDNAPDAESDSAKS